MTVRFKGTELRPVLAEAVANKCRVILIKDQGVSWPSAASAGPMVAKRRVTKLRKADRLIYHESGLYGSEVLRDRLRLVRYVRKVQQAGA